MRGLLRGWTLAVLALVYLPILAGALAGLSRSRYFLFPPRDWARDWSLDWWAKVAGALEIRALVANSLLIAAVVTVLAVGFGLCGALAFARHGWRGRRWFQRLVLLPLCFPQPVLGLAALMWFDTLGIGTGWRTAAVAHLVWIVPVVTLVIAIRVYGFDPALEEAAADLGASRLAIWREVTLPMLWPGIWSGALFAFLLSWGNFPLSLYTAGADGTVPKWLYAKMVAGYSPMVPALGTMSTIAAALVLGAGAAVARLARGRG
ncbi:ABC transporter permease [Frigidibacter sp. MR17.24]|uniref:ABC transporter permease n=1 Tax=Frigidibacter sp. MR17.24 TaxID=3127345 RepID=UPI003012F5A4